MKYKEIFKLKEMLEKAEIPFEFSEFMNGFHLCYPNNEIQECSVIEHDGSYGREQDLLEIMGLLTNEELKHDEVVVIFQQKMFLNE